MSLASSSMHSSSTLSSRPLSGVSVVTVTGSGAVPMLYGYFPRRFTIRSSPSPSSTWQWDKSQMLPRSYNPASGRVYSAVPLNQEQKQRGSVSRLMRPTASSIAKQNFPWTKDAKVVGKYAWNNNGIATYRDTTKCVYTDNGGVKEATQRGNKLK